MPVTHVAEQAGSAGNRALKPCKAHGASRSESEPGSASKRNNESGQPIGEGEARTDGEVTGMCTRRALRGGRGQRVPRERSRNLGDPACWGVDQKARLGMHNQLVLHGRKSEGVVVAGKRGNARGAKDPCWQYAESETCRAACEKSPLRYTPNCTPRQKLCPKVKLEPRSRKPPARRCTQTAGASANRVRATPR
jgi:hypothetical protein